VNAMKSGVTVARRGTQRTAGRPVSELAIADTVAHRTAPGPSRGKNPAEQRPLWHLDLPRTQTT
jgi:hypothetical protein